MDIILSWLSMNNLKFRKIILFSLALLGATPAFARQLSVVGTGDGLEILRAVAKAFEADFPGDFVEVPPSIGSGGAIASVGSDREMLGRIARPLTANELASGLVYHPVFRVPTAFYVHPDVRPRSLTSLQLRTIFSGEVGDWSELGGPAMRIRIVRREEADSSLAVLRAALPAFRDLRFTERSKLAQTTQEAIESIRDNPGAIGFAPFSAALAKELGVIKVDGLSPEDEGYASGVELALIYKSERLTSEARRWISYFTSDRARRIIRGYGAKPVVR